jgi:macrodomain Ter protein organizer (MatP/YcbG family)
VQNLLDRVAQADSKGINKARREVITNEELPKLADDLGMTVDDLMNRRQGEAFNAEQILAARKILVASSENLIELGKKAADGGDTNLALFRRAMTQHRAIQQQVSGMTAEAGRALQSFNIIAESSRMQQRAIKDALDATGGADVNQKMAQMFASFDNAKQVGDMVRRANKVKSVDMLYEVWINGLLSSPATHMVNILSNTMVAALTVGERRMARALGGNVPPGETTGDYGNA